MSGTKIWNNKSCRGIWDIETQLYIIFDYSFTFFICYIHLCNRVVLMLDLNNSIHCHTIL